MHNERADGRDIVLSPLGSLQAQAQMLGFIAALLIPFALLFFFSQRGRTFRALGWAYVIFLAEMIVLHGKMYYVAPVYPMVFAAGAVWLEGATQRKRWIWAKPALAVGITAIAGIYAPTIIPLLSVPHFLAYEHKLGIEQQKFEHARQGVLPQLFADMFGWDEMAQRVAAYYHTLSPEEQRHTAIFANNYGDAGGDRLLRPPLRPAQVHRRPSDLLDLGSARVHSEKALIVLRRSTRAPRQHARPSAPATSIIGTTETPLSPAPMSGSPSTTAAAFKLDLQTHAWPALNRLVQ